MEFRRLWRNRNERTDRVSGNTYVQSVINVPIRFPQLIRIAAMLLSLAQGAAFAGNGWQVTSWTTENALPQGVVYAIHQTGDGYLWFTTLGGLVRYDGVEFTVFTKATTRGLRSSRFTTLFESDDGALWVGTEDGFITRYRNGVFETTSVDGTLAPVLATGADHANRISVWTRNGLFVLDGKRLVHVGPKVATDYSVYRTGFAAVTPAGVTILDFGSAPQTLPFVNHFAANTHAVTSDERSLWIIDGDRVSRVTGGRVTPVEHPILRDFLRSPHGPITAFSQTLDGAFWVADSTRGIARIDDSQIEWITLADGLCSLAIARIYEDREGTIWATSLGGGISEMRRRAAHTYGAAEGLEPANAFPVMVQGSGLLVGSWGGGVYRFDGKRFERALPASGAVMSLADGGDGSIWVAVGSGGVLRVHGNEVRRFDRHDGVPAIVRAIHRSRDGRLWFGTNDGLATISKDDRFVSYRTSSPDTNFIQTIADDRDGALLLGTRGGVLRFRDGRFALVADERSGLSSNAVRAIHVDGDGTIWIGTYDGGIDRIRNGKVAGITTRQGLFDNGVFAIVEEGGYFWMSSNRGVHRASRRELNAVADGEVNTLSAIALTRSDGLRSPECNGGIEPAAVRTADGLIWFPTQQGIVSIDPKLVPTDFPPPPIHVTSVAVDGEQVSPATEVRVPPGSKRIEFRFAAPMTGMSRLIRYRYRLEGFDTRWTEMVGARVATYTRMPPGHYRFIVSASNAGGRWSAAPAAVALRVVPPLWQTWWFRLGAAVLVVLLLWMMYRMRIGTLEKKQAAQAEFSRLLLRQQEEERKRVSSELHDSLGQSLLIIKNRALLGIDGQSADAAHAQLEEISETASTAIDEVRRIAHNLRPAELDHLGLTRSVEALLRRMSSSSAILFSGDLESVDALLTDEAQVSVFRIVQEWTSNVARHSQANAALISLKREDRRLRLRILDDGTGFSRATAAQNERLGIGLRSIAERVHMLGGTYDISSTGEGTAMTVDLPLPETS
jgi:signal transduction histidine kinase/ligand-binding sensor domain-containing protein